MIILCANQKGGVGKSSITCNFAAYLAQQGKDVLIVDADRQPTSSKWIQERELNTLDLPVIHCAQRYGAINKTIKDFSHRYEYVLVDVGGHLSEEMQSALLVADILLMPFRPSQPDLDTTEEMVSVIKKSHWINEKLKAYAVLSIAPTTPNAKELAATVAYFEPFTDIQLVKSVIHDRKVFRDCMSEGMGVVEMSGSSVSEASSRREIAEMVSEVLSGY
jgi:chromosome partitioning protein